ncbi:MAG TPA: hypothetical protein DCS30_09555 [Rhizobiales bacterium]|nr:hypothetical protein [Hyphomicrobiales bacterium]
MVGRLYWPDPETKRDPVRRWARQDRCFFGYGACHILAGAFLKLYPDQGFKAHWIQPIEGYYGNHIFVAQGDLAFDHHGYCHKKCLLNHLMIGWKARYEGWDFKLVEVKFDLLDTTHLNERNMLGARQYLHDAEKRADAFVKRYPAPHRVVL